MNVRCYFCKSGKPVGTVVSQDPKPGETAGEGASISVRVSGKQIEVLPDVEGKTIEEARQSIRSHPFGLEVKTIESSTQEIGRVISQDPKSGDGVTAEAGTYVTLTVGAGAPAAKVPNLRAPHFEETPPKLGDGPVNPNDRGSEGQDDDPWPFSGTEIEPDESV